MFNEKYNSFEDFVYLTQVTIFRVWFVDELEEYPDSECSYYYFRTAIPLNNGDYLIGMESPDGRNGNLRYIRFDRLSNLNFDYTNKDQEGWED